MCEEYNGWTNRETWAVNLWIDNERGLYERVQEMAKENDNLYDLTESLKDLFDELFDMESIFGDNGRELVMMMNDIGSLYRVNWAEIARNIWEESQLQEANA